MALAWLCIPSARPAAEVQPVVDAWRGMGYKVALWRDNDVDVACDLPFSDGQGYPGYATSVNLLAAEVLEHDPECQWIIAGGDDTLPDPNKTADEIAGECIEFFKRRNTDIMHHPFNTTTNHPDSPYRESRDGPYGSSTFGVMQPTGDRFAGGSIDRIAGSPWMGRAFCERMYGGNGPLYHGYEHMHVDEELLCVAEKLGVYWRRPDLVHLHMHFMRETEDLNSRAVQREVPPHLKKWNTTEHWNSSKALFMNRKAMGFPSHEPIGAMVRNLKLDNGDPDYIEVRA